MTGNVLMKAPTIRIPLGCLICLAAWILPATFASAKTVTIRIVCYNIEDDINGATTPLPGLIAPSGGGVTGGGVLEGIGEEMLGSDPPQPLDILALEETTSNPVTVAPIVSGLNTYYNLPGMYAMSTYQATESGGDTADGNGPNAMVYNTRTLQLVASVPVLPSGGTSKLGSSSGEYREVMRYEFAPAGVTPSPTNEFYIYVSHYKSGTTSSDLTARGEEAVIIRNDEASNLPANARVIYVGDYNVTTSGEASYQTMLAASAPNGIAQGQGIDPLNLSGATNIDWGTGTLLNMKTESATDLRYRDDLQVMTANVYNGVAGGLSLVAGTFHAFGNNGTTPYQGSVNSGSNTSLNSDLHTNAFSSNLISASTLYADLSTASDHLPVVADYTIVVPDPPVASFNGSPTNGAAPLTVTFTDTSTGSVTNWSWIFGDGSTTNLVTSSVVHTYTNAGAYSVTEIVTGPFGSGTNTQTGYITVMTPFQAWQLQYFGCTNCPQAQPGADADGTGQNNQFKYMAGLNPTNPSSIFVFTIAGVTNQATWKNLIFSPVVAGRIYSPQFSTNPVSGSWMPLVNFAKPSVTNGNQVTITDTNTVLSQEFYRINISMP